MNYLILRVSAFILLPALFVYLIASFLMSTFDINLWYPHQRFIAVVTYFLLISAVAESDSRDKKKKASAKGVGKNSVKEEVGEVVQQ